MRNWDSIACNLIAAYSHKRPVAGISAGDNRVSLMKVAGLAKRLLRRPSLQLRGFTHRERKPDHHRQTLDLGSACFRFPFNWGPELQVNLYFNVETMDMNSKQFVLLKRPVGMPDESNFGLEEVPIASGLSENELRLHGLYYSVDPYMRGRMNEAKSYVTPFALNQPIEGGVVARVVESKSPDFKSGDLVMGQLPWATDVVVLSEKVHKIDTKDSLPSEYLGVLGVTGLTAYFGLLKIGQPKAGETVVISGAAGAVGSVVGQIAKIKECKVIGIVGTAEKAKVLKERFKFDEAINYREASDLAGRIKQACPNGVDVYFDNVGGVISDAVIQNMNFHSRIVLCGQISLYNSKDVQMGPRLQPLLLTRSILMQGFIIGNFQAQFPEGIETLSKWLAAGRLESTETVVVGFENLPKALISLFSGKNTGKMIVKAAA